MGARPVARLHLAGEVARLAGLPDALAPEIEGTAAPIALAGAAAERITPAEAPGLALALALALRGHLGARAGRINFRRGELSYTRDFEHLKGRIARLGAYAALVVVVAVLSAGVKVFALSRQEAALDRALCDAESKIVGRCFRTSRRPRRCSADAAPPAPPSRGSRGGAVAELASKVPEGVPVRLDRVEVTKDKLHLQGTTDAAENVDRIATSLKGSRCFADAGRAARAGARATASSSSRIDASLDLPRVGSRAVRGKMAMETWKQLRADAEAWLGKLAPRERVLVTAAAASVIAFVIWLVSHSIAAGIRRRASPGSSRRPR